MQQPYPSYVQPQQYYAAMAQHQQALQQHQQQQAMQQQQQQQHQMLLQQQQAMQQQHVMQQQQQQAMYQMMGYGMNGMQPGVLMGGALNQQPGYGMQGHSAAAPSPQPASGGQGQGYVSPSLNRYASPVVQNGRAGGSGPSTASSSAQGSAAAGNARFKSPGRAAAGGYASAMGNGGYASAATGGGYAAAGAGGGYAAAGAAAASAGPSAAAMRGAGCGPGSAVSMYAQQAAYAQHQAMLAQQQQQQYQQQYQQLLESPSASSQADGREKDGLPYSRKPRVVDFQPYDMKVRSCFLLKAVRADAVSGFVDVVQVAVRCATTCTYRRTCLAGQPRPTHMLPLI